MLNRLRRSLPALAALDDHVRSRLYLFVRRSARPVPRDEAAAHAGISDRLAAFHLDKLVKKGLLKAHYARKPGRTGPGAGRSSKFYEVSDLEIDLTIPERRYDLAGEILVAAIEAEESGEEARSAALRIAGTRGRELGMRIRKQSSDRGDGGVHAMQAASDALADLGFEPYESESGNVSLRSCPFHTLARKAPELVCGMNRSFIDGLLRGLGNNSVTASLEPEPNQCCVVLRAPQ